ncbi:MAG: phosphoribosylformylglycinamidine synthase subunit PurL [Candidatus Thermoplasmatota archaeon]|nr:phosphoribosylformylglycinamidine synthase subunit PurL [Candidatus Thermoplasmatota archaeon]
MNPAEGVIVPITGKAYPDGDVHEVKLLETDLKQMAEISDTIGWGLSLEELAGIKEHFQTLERNPTDIEMEALGQGWSEHCCYKTSKPVLRDHVFGIEEEKVLLREDAGVLDYDEDHVYAVRIESHNHPSAIEPYGGAATGVGGILRDITCMGSQPIALADMLFFGPPEIRHEDLPQGTRHPTYLAGGVIAGIRDYGNRVGIPNLSGSIHFHPDYTTNCLVNVACLGIGKKENVTRSISGPPGSIWVLAGGRTGRDGIHGVTFASKDLSEESHQDVPAVQLGDPITKEPLIHACLQTIEEGLVRGMKDLGGGGLSCAVGEMCEAGGVGADIELTEVHLKADGMKPWEIWVSESQERMMLSVGPEDLDRVLEIMDLWDVPAVVLGEATEDTDIKARWHGEVIFHLDPIFCYEGPELDRPTSEPEPREIGPEPGAPEAWDKAVLAVLEDPNVACRAPLLRQYDHTVRASTVVPPWIGPLNADGHADATVVKPLKDAWSGLAMATALNPAHTALDPRRGSLGAMDELVRDLACVGARVDSVTDCLNFPNPEKPEGMWTFQQSVKALGEAARALKVPFASGNVSLYNESHAGAVPATPTLFGIGKLDDIRNVVTSDAKGHDLVLVGATRPEFGGSVYARTTGTDGQVPDVDLEALSKASEAVVTAIENDLVTAAHDPSEGGLIACLIEMGMAGMTGMEVDLTDVHDRAEVAAFSESNTRWVLETEDPATLIEHLEAQGVPATRLGRATGDAFVIHHGDQELLCLPVKVARQAWHGALSTYFGGEA